MNKKLVRILAVLLAAVMSVGLVSSALPLAFAASSDEIQEEIDELEAQAVDIEKEIDALQEEIDANDFEMQGIIEQKDALDRQMNLTLEEIQNTEETIEHYESLIESRRLELREAKEKEREQLDHYILRIREMEENGNSSYLSILFQASSFSDLLDRLDWIEEISAADNRMMETLSETSSDIQKSENQLYEYQAKLEEQNSKLLESKARLEEESAEAQLVIDQLANASEEMRLVQEEYDRMEDDLFAMIAKKQDEYDEAKRKEEEAKRKEAEQQNPGSSSSSYYYYSDSLSFIRPVEGGWISSPYGWRVHPIYGTERFHAGEDIAVNQGTPIHASASGYVTLASYDSSCGNWVMISHANGYASAYLHMLQYIVSEGQYVEQGQTIGYVGTTGASTGPHLHFAMYYNGAYVNPADYIGSY